MAQNIMRDRTVILTRRIDHNDLRVNSIALNPGTAWFEFLRKDTLSLYAHISVISSLRNIALGIEDQRDSHFFLMEAIRHINQRLVEERETRRKLSDGLIVAVAILVNKEVRCVKPE
jgi:glucose-6-phosphate-specific signal transduction histidine kinase